MFTSQTVNQPSYECYLEGPPKSRIFSDFFCRQSQARRYDSMQLQASPILNFWTCKSRKRFRFQIERIGLAWSRVELPKNPWSKTNMPNDHDHDFTG